VSVWRKLQRYGSLPLGNSGYLLPNDLGNREKFEWLATTIRGSDGEASVLEVQSIDNYSGTQLQKRFTDARTADYRQLLKDLRVARRRGGAGDNTRLRRRFQEIASIDFFGSPLREQVEKSLTALQQPKPPTLSSEFGPVSRSAYQNRTWITRSRPGVDRVMSAWLIRTFIDPKAKFAFATENQKLGGAVPFDMYEGGFGHRGEDCTFETLAKAFRIKDKGVAIMGEVVHDADIFDDKFGRREGFGIDEIMKGWAQTIANDAELLDRGMQLAQGLYQSLRKKGKQLSSRG